MLAVGSSSLRKKTIPGYKGSSDQYLNNCAYLEPQEQLRLIMRHAFGLHMLALGSMVGKRLQDLPCSSEVLSLTLG